MRRPVKLLAIEGSDLRGTLFSPRFGHYRRHIHPMVMVVALKLQVMGLVTISVDFENPVTIPY
jgi:hypothetical protein